VKRVASLFVLALVCSGCNLQSHEAGGATPAASSSSGAVVSRLGTAWPNGSQGEYQVTLDSQIDFGRERGASALELRARLRYVVRAVQVGAPSLLLVLRDVSLKTGAPGELKDNPELVKEIQAPFGLTLVDGALGDLRVRPGASTFAVSILRNLAASLQFAASAGKNGAFVGHESDGTGAYDVEYTRLDGSERYARRKLRYEPLPALQVQRPGAPALDNLALDFTPHVAESAGAVELQAGKLTRSSYTELLTTSAPDGSQLTSRTKLALEAQSVLTTAAPDEAAWAQAELVLKPGVAYANANEKSDLDAHRIGDFTFESALSVLEQAERNSKQPPAVPSPGVEPAALPSPGQREASAFLALTALFRRDPANVAKALKHIKARSSAAEWLQNALASSGAAAAEDALLSLASDPKLPAAQRRASVTNLSRAPIPRPVVVERLSALVADPALHVPIVYALGAIARKMRAAGQQEAARPLVDLLVSQLEKAQSEQDTITALHGIANAADPAVFARVRPFLSDASSSLRQAGGLAVGSMQSQEAEAALAERLATEPRTSVRTALLSICRQRPPSPVLIAAVRELALKAAEPHGRIEAVRVLAQWATTEPKLRETLALVAQNDPVGNVRDTAAKTLQ
jgi:hypothetical protein